MRISPSPPPPHTHTPGSWLPAALNCSALQPPEGGHLQAPKYQPPQDPAVSLNQLLPLSLLQPSLLLFAAAALPAPPAAGQPAFLSHSGALAAVCPAALEHSAAVAAAAVGAADSHHAAPAHLPLLAAQHLLAGAHPEPHQQ